MLRKLFIAFAVSCALCSTAIAGGLEEKMWPFGKWELTCEVPTTQFSQCRLYQIVSTDMFVDAKSQDKFGGSAFVDAKPFGRVEMRLNVHPATTGERIIIVIGITTRVEPVTCERGVCRVVFRDKWISRLFGKEVMRIRFEKSPGIELLFDLHGLQEAVAQLKRQTKNAS